MIQQKDSIRIKQWFDKYVHQFYTGDKEIDSAISLKVKHTGNVVAEILDIGSSLNLRSEQRYLAEIVAILHDIGRFEQFITYHTYMDRKSEDHAQLGLKVIAQTGIIDGFTSREQDLIRNAVAHHNQFSLPETDDKELLLYLKLLRDADKIDILRVVTEHYNGSNCNDAINLGLSDTPEISDQILRSITNNALANIKDMKTVNDFKLLQISWVYDLNFPRTFQLFRERQYLDKLSAALPQTEKVIKAIYSARCFLLSNGNADISIILQN